MANYNRVFLMGNLTAEPETRNLPTGGVVTDIRLAVNRAYRTREGEAVEEVSYIDCTAYGRTAEVARDYTNKGSPVFVEGRLHQDRWETNDGEKRSKLKVIVERLILMPRKGDASGSPARETHDASYEPPPESGAADF